MTDEPTRADELAKRWRDAKHHITVMEEATEEALKADPTYMAAKAALAEAEGQAIALLDSTGAENIRTKYGTIHTTVRFNASVQDPDAFKSFVIEQRAWDALDLKCNTTFAKSFNLEHKLNVPGVTLTSKRTLSVTAPK